ncbi:MAG: polysaccharide deacetylase family protein [Vicinamibacteria bacterium]|nr:polysaccharide deacetylase family protein [Vicinamibacteria bacterium]
MKLSRWFARLVIVSLATLMPCGCSEEPYGAPQVMSFKDGKRAAFSMHFDDSMESQVENALPLLNARGFVGTFFVNPGSERYGRYRQVWEVECIAHGHELADHTMIHGDVLSYAQADHEIGECARIIRGVYDGAPRLLPYITPGGVRWDVSDAQLRELLDKHELFLAERSHGCCPSSHFADITIPVLDAINRGAWTQLGFHGIGGEWLSTDVADLVGLLDYLDANRNVVWIATTSDAYKYQQEREAVRVVSLADATDAGFSVEIACDESRVNTFGRPFADLYDQPLTLRVSVPAHWTSYVVTQQTTVDRYGMIEENGRKLAQFDVRPNVGPADVRVAED